MNVCVALRMWRWAVERDRRSVGMEGEGMERTRSKQHRGVSCNLWNDRLFVVGLPQTMSRPLRAVSRRLLGVSAMVALLPKCRRGLPSVHRGAGRGHCRGRGMKSAASSMGGRNVACVWSPCEMEKGVKQTGIDGSEKQA